MIKKNTILICSVRTCFPYNRLISTLANESRNNLGINDAEVKQILEKSLQCFHAMVDRVTQMDDPGYLLRPYIIRLKQARD